MRALVKVAALLVCSTRALTVPLRSAHSAAPRPRHAPARCSFVDHLVVDDATAQREVREAFEAYEQALEVNDVAALDNAFWRSDRTVRLARDEHGFGWDQIHEHRERRNFQPGGNSKGERISLSVTTFGRAFATVFLVYRLKAYPLKLGRQTQSWVAFPTSDGARAWKVTTAHVSLAEFVAPAA